MLTELVSGRLDSIFGIGRAPQHLVRQVGSFSIHLRGSSCSPGSCIMNAMQSCGFLSPAQFLGLIPTATWCRLFDWETFNRNGRFNGYRFFWRHWSRSVNGCGRDRSTAAVTIGQRLRSRSVNGCGRDRSTAAVAIGQRLRSRSVNGCGRDRSTAAVAIGQRLQPRSVGSFDCGG